jgi:hypothetical protein
VAKKKKDKDKDKDKKGNSGKHSKDKHSKKQNRLSGARSREVGIAIASTIVGEVVGAVVERLSRTTANSGAVAAAGDTLQTASDAVKTALTHPNPAVEGAVSIAQDVAKRVSQSLSDAIEHTGDRI